MSCGSGQDEIFVFAAASLTDVMERLGDEFEAQQGVKVRINVGASESLAQQIARGAPADVFIAAGVRPVELLEKKDLLVEGARQDLLTNVLVVVVSAGDSPEVASIQDLLKGDFRVAIADPDLAPAGQYARESLVNLGLWAKLKPRIVYGANVRTALGYVESENAGAALVYSTDAAVTDRVRTVATLPPDSYTPIKYPGVVIKGSERRALAQQFLTFLAGDRAAAIFSEYGFAPATSP